jgi:hypothetical protein
LLERILRGAEVAEMYGIEAPAEKTDFHDRASLAMPVSAPQVSFPRPQTADANEPDPFEPNLFLPLIPANLR